MKYRAYKNKFWNEKEIEKPKIKHLSKIELLHELPFYDELSVAEISKAFRRYARSYKVEIIEPKDPLVQLEARKSSTEDLFKDLLNKMKGFKVELSPPKKKCIIYFIERPSNMMKNAFYFILKALFVIKIFTFFS